MAQQAYSAWRDANVAFVIGLPNEKWGTRAQALGWQTLFPLQWLVRPLRPEAMIAGRYGWPALKRATLIGATWNAAMSTRVRRARAVQVEPVGQAGAVFDHIWERCRSDWTFSTIRDSHWIEWRFLSSPSRKYTLSVARQHGEPTGYMAYALLNSEDRSYAHLAEICAARTDSATRNSLLASLIEALRATPTESVRTLSVPGTAEFAWLRHAGFFPGPAFGVQLMPLAPDLPVGRMLDRQQWNLTGADFDVI